jgi:hypothetical protein
MKSYFFRVIHLAKLFRMLEPPHSAETAAAEIQSFFAAILMRGMYEDAYLIAFDFHHLQDSPTSNALLRVLLNDQKTPSLVKAKVMRDLAQSRKLENIEVDPDDLEATAKDIFVQSGHVHGALDIDFNRACRSLKNGTGSMDDHWATVQNYLREIEALDDQNKALHIIGAIQDAIDHLQSFDIQRQLVRECEERSREGGARLFWILRRIGAIAHWLRHSGHTSKSIEGAEVLFKEISTSDCRWIKGFVAQNLAHAYVSIKDHDRAVEWARMCYSNWAPLEPLDRAEARKEVLNAEMLSRFPTIDVLVELVETTWSHVQEEIVAGLSKPAIEKIEIILSMILMHNRNLDAAPWIATFDNLLRNLPEPEATIKRADFYQIQADFSLADGRGQPDTDNENKAVELMEKSIPLYIAQKLLFQAANSRQKCALIHLAIHQKSPSITELQTAVEQFEVAGNYFSEIDHALQIEINTFWIAFCCYEGWCRKWLSGSLVLDSLVSAELVRDQQRSELSILGGLDAITSKQRLRTDKNLRKLYNMAFTVCSKDDQPEKLWEWIQKAKARSLSDALGLGVLVPEVLETKVQKYNETRDLYNEERKLQSALKTCSGHQRLALRGDLWAVQKQMKKHSCLMELIGLREGHSVDLNRIKKLLPSDQEALPRSRLIFVDWFLMDARIHVCILKDQGSPFVRRCEVEYSSVLSWKIAYLDSKEGRSKSIWGSDDEDNPFRQLDPLVAPLKDVAGEGSIFIFSVTDVLHSLPLHALWLEDEPIIVNHPVVYSVSMTTFVQCRDRSYARKGVPQSMAILAAYEMAHEEIEEDFVKERKAIKKSVDELGLDTGATTFFGKASSKQALTSALQSYSLVHFHGHCHLNESAITDQALVLPEGSFSVRDIFNVKQMARHVTLIACASASQGITAGDEPLGIVSALLYAGASSVLGTIWPIASRCGREFSRLFYTEMRACSRESTVDLAVALQQTVVKIIKSEYEKSSPYYWASFVLHGSNLF